MATFKSFFEKFMAFMLIAMAAVINFSCDKADVGDEVGRRTTETPASFKETSKLTTDDTYGTATLSVSSEKYYGETSQGSRNGEAQATCKVSVETDPVETSHKEAKTYTVGDLQTSQANGNTIVTCDITVSGNGQENVLKTRTVIEPTMVWDNTYDLKLKSVKVNEAGVKMVETTKKQGESGRQALSIPVVFSFDAVGTKEAHTGDVTLNAVYEQFQKETTPEIDHEEIASATHTVTNGKDDYVVKVKQVWTDGSETFVEYPYSTTHYFNTISLEDMIVKSWAYSLSKVEGLSVGSESKVKEDGFFTEYSREDLYSALHANGQDANIKTVYMAGIPKVVFTKGELSYTFDFISPSFTENSDDLLDGTSTKSGYDLRVFRNAITAKYGNAETGVDEQTLEERANLYKQARAVKSIEVADKIKNYKSYAIDYTVKYRLVYNDDEKSDIMEITTSRPWSLSYNGAWSMVATGDVNQSTTAAKVSSTGSNSEKQTIANGYWNCTTTNYSVANITTVDGKQQTNSWNASVPTEMVLNLYNTEVKFEKDELTAEAKDIKIALTNSTATQENYKFSENLNATVGTDTEISEGYGFVTKAVEVTVKSWSWENCWQKVEGNLTKAHVEKVYVMTDGSKKTVSRDFTYTRNSQVITYWETTEANNNESTGAAQFSVVSNEAKSEGDWKFNLVKTELKFGVTCASTTQTDGWSILEANNLSVEIEGDVYTFDEMSYSASANASQSKTAESDNQTTYTHTNTPNYTFGGYSMSLASANGKIFVNKVVTPEHHDGFFPDWYGKLEGDNKAACRSIFNQKDWGIGGSLKFTNGSLPYFISKDGIITFGEFEKGSTVWNAASPDGNGTLRNCNAKDASTAMKWVREATINMLSYSDGTLMGFNDGHNTVSTSKFPGTIEQHDGGKWQSISFAGARTADGRTSFDTSF